MCSIAFCFRVSKWSTYLFHFASHIESIPSILGFCCKKRLLFDRTLLLIRTILCCDGVKVSLCVGAFSIDFSACHVLLCVLLPEHEKWMLITDETSAIIEYHMVVCLRFFFSRSLYRFMFVHIECTQCFAHSAKWLIVVNLNHSNSLLVHSPINSIDSNLFVIHL